MNLFATILFIAASLLLLVVGRKWAPVPLLLGCCYLPLTQGMELGVISLPIFRLLVLVGLLRVIVKGEWMGLERNRIDMLVCFLGVWVLFASFFHTGDFGSGPLWASGFVFNFLGVYFLVRVWCRSSEEVMALAVALSLILAPLALEMISEKLTGKNSFSVFGGVGSEVMLRNGDFRAKGPFRHPILAGTVGAVCIPLFIGIYRSHRAFALIGLLAGVGMVWASSSSGPILSAIGGVAVVGAWKHRRYVKLAKVGALAVCVLYPLIYNEPGYYILKRLDITGSSTGYHRARLIDSAFMNIGDWWLFGTDYTRHWMATGVSYSPNHTDITNYYLAFAVNGGLPAMLALITALWFAFKVLGSVVSVMEDRMDPGGAFFVWCVGASLFAHMLTCISVSYFDQSLAFFWLTLAAVASLAGILDQEDYIEGYEREDPLAALEKTTLPC